MALPTLLFNASTGSDSASSGAGPATALTGTAGATDGGGTTVTLDAGTDLSGVATDGSHVIWINDTTGGHRNFSKITAKAGSGGAMPTVTVSPAFTGSLSGKTWAIGGKRATWNDSSSRRLFSDALAGWTIQTETDQSISSSALPLTSGGDSAGWITVKGDSTSTRRSVTQSANAAVFSVDQAGWLFENLVLLNSNGSKSSADGVAPTTAMGNIAARNCIFGDAGGVNNLNNGMYRGGTNYFTAIACTFINLAGTPIGNGNAFPVVAAGCFFYNCAGWPVASGMLVLIDCVLAGSTGDGAGPAGPVVMSGCTVYDAAGDGVEVNSLGDIIMSSLFVENGGYGVRGNASTLANYNAFRNNTSGQYAGLSAGPNDVTLSGDPFTSAGAGDFSLNATAGAGGAARAAGFPGPFPGGLTTGYADIGAVQHQDSGGGGSSGQAISVFGG